MTLEGRTILVVLAHPDDEALACGGTLARAVDSGARVVLVCASRGELGSTSDPALVLDGDLGSARARELEASAEALGIDEVLLLGHPDGELRWADSLERDVADVVARVRPDAVITFDADGLYWHADHIGVHESTTRAVSSLGADGPPLYYVTMPAGAMRAVAEAARAHGAAPDSSFWGISPDAFGAAAPPATFRVDVRDWAGRKRAALRCHRTQAGPRSPLHWIDESDTRACLGFELFRRAPLATTKPDLLEALAESAMSEAGARTT